MILLSTVTPRFRCRSHFLFSKHANIRVRKIKGALGLMVNPKDSRKLGFFLTVLLLAIQVLFQLQWLNLLLLILIGLFISVAFYREEHRVFVWCMNSFAIGLFALVYIDRILIELPLSRPELLIVNRLLLMIPIALMSYVLLKFGYLKKMNEETTWIGGLKKRNVRSLFWIVLSVNLIMLIFALWGALPVSLSNLSYAIVFSIISGTFMEILWRGILLSRMESIIGAKPSVFFTSISSALAAFMFGFSLFYCLLFLLMGILQGIFTLRAKSLFPAITVSVVMNFTLVLMNIIPIMS